ncbi:MAG TPA: TIGR03936 family radical SAM-associated protein [Anaerolineales bacterium]|nr:TIGR03936 family radical SAM-associated protein [Anaerolineales bacterium]
MRLRLTYAKTSAMRFTGHLDVHRTLYRTLMRARLPITFSEGFTRRPKLVMAGALPLGVTSDCELADLWLDEVLPLDEITAKIEQASPPGLRLLALEELDPNAPKAQNQVFSADYLVTLFDPLPDLEQKIAALLTAETLPRTRKDKKYDLRPLVLGLEQLPADDEGKQRVKMTLTAQDAATGRPDEVVAQLGGDPLGARYHRTALHLK